MSADQPAQTTAASDFSIDSQTQTFATAARAYLSRLRSGDLGAVPAILSIGVLVAVFGSARTPTFMSVRNLGNLLQQAAPIMVISMAVSFVLLLGEIDLAAGFTAGVTAAVLATKLRAGWALLPTLLACAVVAAALGLWTGFLVARVGIPSFVVTLANFLSFQGILLLITKEGGTIGITNKTVNAIEGDNLRPVLCWVGLVIAVIAFGVSLLAKQRNSHGTIPLSVVIVKVTTLAVIGAVFVQLLSKNRAFEQAKKKLQGVPYAAPLVIILMLILTFVLTRTAYGRHLYAVGGNAEAARRAGINVQGIRMSAFIVCGFLAGIGGVFLASRSNSVDPQTGGNKTLLLAVGAAVIGGTSLFGGKGRMLNSLLGGLVLALIENGLPLIGKAKPFGFKDIDFSQSGVAFIVTGLVLLLAASVDALSRKRTG